MRNRYLDVAKIIRNSLKQTKHKELKEYLGRTAISRAYEAVFLELFYYFTEDLKVSYTQMKKLAREYYKEKGLKDVPINKHTSVGAYVAVNYGEVYGELYEKLRKARNDVDYNLELEIFPLELELMKFQIILKEQK
ncbi:MAG: hypothetical protein Q9M89_00200 [Persephonella sp.]|nr:hypothetical protein [Persephonella sp.]